MKRKYRKKTPLQRIKKKCDDTWSLAIRTRDKTCRLKGRDKVRCGGVLQAAHIRGRGHYGIRHFLTNGIGVCQGHHIYYTHHPSEWDELVERLYPGRLKQLDYFQKKYQNQIASGLKPHTLEYFEKLLKNLKHLNNYYDSRRSSTRSQARTRSGSTGMEKVATSGVKPKTEGG